MGLIDGPLPKQLPRLAVEALGVQLSLFESREENVLPRQHRRGLAGRTAVRHATFLSLPKTVGKPLSADTPDPFGPRKRLQPSPGCASARSRSGKEKATAI